MSDSLREMRVLREARYIPDGEPVTKRGGDKLYTLRHHVTVYRENEPKRVLEPGTGKLFLVDKETGDMTEFASDKILAWSASCDDLITLLAPSMTPIEIECALAEAGFSAPVTSHAEPVSQ